MVETANLFPKGIVHLPEAPSSVLERTRYESNYYAFAQKRYGEVTPQEFTDLATRLLRICNMVYGESKVTPRTSSIGVASTELGRLASSHEALLWPADKPDPLGAVDQAEEILSDVEAFEKLFNHGAGIEVRIEPLNFPKVETSFAEIFIDNQAPRIMWLYAQPPFNYNSEGSGNDPTLIKLLYKHMFHVKDAPPNLKFSAGVGIENNMKQQRKAFGSLFKNP